MIRQSALRMMIVASVFCITMITAERGECIEIGEEFPSFYLKDINGNNFFLSDYIGEKAQQKSKAIFFSFCASYCEPCKREIPELEKLLEKYNDSGLNIFLIALEKNDMAKQLVAETETTLPVLIDRYLVVQKQVGFTALPFTVLVDSEGKVRLINTAFSEKNAADIMQRFENAVMDVLGIDPGDSVQ